MDTAVAILDGGLRVYILVVVGRDVVAARPVSTSEHVETRKADTIPTGRVSEIEVQQVDLPTKPKPTFRSEHKRGSLHVSAIVTVLIEYPSFPTVPTGTCACNTCIKRMIYQIITHVTL